MTTLSAYTPSGGYIYYPPYLNLKRDGEEVIFTVRNRETTRQDPEQMCGTEATIAVPVEEAKALLREALDRLTADERASA